MIKFHSSQYPGDCCGCRACEQVCPKKAISFFEDDEGFAYPRIDVSACIDCGLCEKVCPMENADNTMHAKGNAYAFQLSDKEILSISSSGGAFAAIANIILDEGGVVYGAAWENRYVRHRRIQNREELPLLMGSKYVQSDTNDTYHKVKDDLCDGRLVYYTGTPCQIAGLRLYLRKEYNNLITSDLVCHGTPSPKLLDLTIANIESRVKGKFKEYNFRDKKVKGWSCSSSSCYEKKNGKLLYLKHSKEMEAYFNAFISGHLMRYNCYQCPFAQPQRVSDITIADYWGVKRLHPEFPESSKGMSLVLSNTSNGNNILKKLSEKNFLQEVDFDEAARSNLNILQPSPYHKEREESYKLAYNYYPEFIRKYYVGNYLKNKIRSEIEFFIRSNEWIFTIVSRLSRLRK